MESEKNMGNTKKESKIPGLLNEKKKKRRWNTQKETEQWYNEKNTKKCWKDIEQWECVEWNNKNTQEKN